MVIAETVGIYLLLKNEAELKWVAGYVLVNSAFFCLLMIITVDKILKGRLIEGITHSVYVLTPFTGILTAIIVQQVIYENLSLSEGAKLAISSTMGSLASLSICLPFVFRANRILGITKLITHTSKAEY